MTRKSQKHTYIHTQTTPLRLFSHRVVPSPSQSPLHPRHLVQSQTNSLCYRYRCCLCLCRCCCCFSQPGHRSHRSKLSRAEHSSASTSSLPACSLSLSLALPCSYSVSLHLPSSSPLPSSPLLPACLRDRTPLLWQ